MFDPGQDDPDKFFDRPVKVNEAPSGFCDCHAHVFGPLERYPAASDDPVEGLEEFTTGAYREVQAQLGVNRVVLVQPDHYGNDHDCLLDAMTVLTKSPDGRSVDLVRGVAAVRAGVGDDELEDLLAAGIIGTRFVMRGGRDGNGWEAADRLAWRVHDFGWDVELEMDGSDLHEVEQTIREWPGRVVLDHIGLFSRTRNLNQQGFAALTRLIDRDKVWVKLSAPYEMSQDRRIDDPVVADFARALVDWAPERMVWGSNWPHVSMLENPPEDLMLLDRLVDWVPEESRRRRILSDNAVELYGFAAEDPVVKS
ncbi:MAG: amidohydrolase family protein [Proteobacteria bacterium]|nr:amidohydrolase family protein [Pseudomonadota bacterium]